MSAWGLLSQLSAEHTICERCRPRLPHGRTPFRRPPEFHRIPDRAILYSRAPNCQDEVSEQIPALRAFPPTWSFTMNRSESVGVLRCRATYVVAGPVFFITLFVITKFIVGLSPIGIAMCTVVVATPILFNGVYHASTSRVLFLQGLYYKGKIFRFCSGYALRIFSYDYRSMLRDRSSHRAPLFSTSSTVRMGLHSGVHNPNSVCILYSRKTDKKGS